MAAPQKYSPSQQAEALRLYETHGPTAVQKKLGIPKGTVTRWAKRDGLETVSVERTRAATQAAAVYSKARRDELKALLLDDAHRLREQLWKPTKVINFGGKDNTLASTILDEPLFADKKNIMSSVSIAVGSAMKIDQADNDNGSDTARSMLERLAEQLEGATLADDGFSGSSEPEAAPLPSSE